MTDDPPRWPHDRFRERLLPVPAGALAPRARAIRQRAGRLRRAIEEALAGPDPGPVVPRILVVEDDGPTRAALGALFSRSGWEVAIAGTVAEGLAGLHPRPDCVLLDLLLPDGDGEVILEAARAWGPATRVVVATGVDDPGRLEAVARLGPDSVLQKPVALDDLCRACHVAS